MSVFTPIVAGKTNIIDHSQYIKAEFIPHKVIVKPIRPAYKKPAAIAKEEQA